MKNPFKRKKKKNPFEASMLIDKPEFKMIEARYNENPFFFAVGTAKQREVKGAGGVGTEGVKGEYQSQKDPGEIEQATKEASIGRSSS